jgi:16S rRNA (cytidine1402-2'-O)-methyltransferase
VGTLYIVGTPIGNLEDISARALDVLCRVSLIASENPQRTQRLLARYDIHTPMARYTDAYQRQKKRRMEAVLAALEQGDVALVSEAGMPGLSDPGFELLHAALEQGVGVIPIPGPTALGAALSVAAMPGEGFAFLGFLPRTANARHDLLAEWIAFPHTLAAYEAPHRLVDTLADIALLFGERAVVVCGDLTKLYEEVRRGTAADLLAHFRQHAPRGEYTLVIAGTGPPEPCGTGSDP